MRTAEEMYEFCVNNNFGHGMTKNWAIKHFTLIQNYLQPDEEIKMCFIGLHNYKSMSKHDNNYAYALTNKRIIMAQKKLVGENIQVVSLNNINDITYSSGALLATITIDTFKECFNVGVDKPAGQSIDRALHAILF